MRIKTNDGEYNVTGQGQGSLNTVLGAVGTAGALGMFNNGLGGIFGGNRPVDGGDRPVTRYEMGLIRDAISKDNEIALLKSQQYTDRAMIGVQAQFGQQTAWNAAQGVNIENMRAMLGSLTRVFVPNANVAPGWGPVIVEPSFAATVEANKTNSVTTNSGN